MKPSSVARKEDYRLLTGQGKFTSDWTLPGQLYAAFLRSDLAHAEITHLDVSAAKTMPGVAATITSTEMREANLGDLPPFITFPGRDGRPYIRPRRDLLAHDRVRYVGEPVVLVVAESLNAAQDAVEQVAITYRDLPVVIDPIAAMQDGALELYPEFKNNIAFVWECGDEAAVDKIFAEAPHVVDAAINNVRVMATPMEPNACVAWWNEDAGRFELYRPMQGLNLTRAMTMGYFGPPAEKYRIIAKDIGGSFGARTVPFPEYLAIMVATQRLGRPIKWVAPRTESILSDPQARSAITGGQLALDETGRFLAVRYNWYSHVGGYPMDSGALGHLVNVKKGAVGPYKILAAYARVTVCVTNTAPVGAYRGAARPEAAMNLEQLVDAAAIELGLDRFEIRKRNVIARNEHPYTTPLGVEYDSGDHAGLIAVAEETIDWKGFAVRRAESAARGKVRGIGCSSYLEAAGSVYHEKDQTEIRFVDDGKVEVYTIANPGGQGSETAFALVVSRELGIPYDNITVKHSDPDGPRLTGMGTGGSRTAQVYGSTLYFGAHEIIKKGLPLAADDLEVASRDIEFCEGAYRVKGTNLAVKLVDVALMHPGALNTVSEASSMATFPGGVHVAEVELDPETGVIEILKYVAVDDTGNVIDHGLVDGQIIGGILQGVGQVMTELVQYDDAGQLITGSFMDYAMPGADLISNLELVDYPVPSPTNILGVKGVGETGCASGLTTTYAAVMDAMRQVGVTKMDMPFSPGRVWQGIYDAKHAAAN